MLKRRSSATAVSDISPDIKPYDAAWGCSLNIKTIRRLSMFSVRSTSRCEVMSPDTLSVFASIYSQYR